jgi:hypothetical protein
MRKLLFLFFTFQLIFNLSNGQTFRLTDTTFHVGDQLIRGQLYNPNCQINIEDKPFLDSLASFLIKNGRIAIEIDIDSDIRGTAELNQMTTEVFGKSRLTNFFKYDYPAINLERIKFGCFGGSQPIYTQKEIDKIIDNVEKEKTYAKNRRTIIKIIQINFKE